MRMKIVKALETVRAVKASDDHAYNATFFVGYLGMVCQTYCKCTGLQPARMATSGGNAAEVDLERS